MRRWIVRIALVLAGIFLAIQLVPAGRTNPPVTKTIEAPPEVLAILRRSCFDCHSNETKWPWYAYVAPVSWMVVRDTDEGRAEVNFSHWGDLTQKKRDSAAGNMLDEIDAGKMPLDAYLWIHSDAKLSPAEVEVLRTWSAGDV